MARNIQDSLIELVTLHEKNMAIPWDKLLTTERSTQNVFFLICLLVMHLIYDVQNMCCIE